MSENKKTIISTKALIEGAIMVALAAILSCIRIYKMPWGGSVTLASMLPIILYSIRYGIKDGLLASFVFALFQLGQGIADGLFSWGLTPAALIGSILLDYLLAYTVIGLGGIFRNKGLAGWIGGTVLAGVLRFVSHFLCGVVIWHSFGELWSGFVTDNEWLYSLVYNGAYMLPEIVFCVIGAVILFTAPQISKTLGSKQN